MISSFEPAARSRLARVSCWAAASPAGPDPTTAWYDDALIMRARPHPTDPNQCWWDKYTLMMMPEGGTESAGSLSFTPRRDPRPDPGERPTRDHFTQEQIIGLSSELLHLVHDDMRGDIEPAE